MLVSTHPRVRGKKPWLKPRGGFSPTQVSAISAWLRLQASAQSGGDWTSWVDVINSNPAAPIDPLRRPAVGASGSLPTAVFNGAVVDTIRWPNIAAINGTAKYGIWMRVKPTSVAGTQYVISNSLGTGGAGANKMTITLTAGGVLVATLYFGGVDKTLSSAGGAITTSAQSVGFTYDNTAGALDTDKFKMFVGSSYISGTYSGAGVPGLLPAPSGNTILGNYQDAAAGAVPFTGTLGPNVFHINGGHLTAQQLIDLDAFEAFT